MRYFFLLFFSLIVGLCLGQQPTDATLRMQSLKKQLVDNQSSLFKDIPCTSIGPTVFSGRVTAIRVNPKNPIEFVVAYASGGLWHTTNNGTSFDPIFDYTESISIGDFDVNWHTKELYVGTGEVNSSRSSYAGTGIYYSSDWGKTWEHIGLEDSHHIGRILIHPTESKTVYVAALGHLYSSNDQRGVFKTTNGGKSWEHVLFINNRTGVVDLEIDSYDPNILVAAAWERDRTAWNFTEGGQHSNIYISKDGGNSFEKTTSNGLPLGVNLGRIGLAVTHKGNQSHWYALIDNQNRRPDKKTTSDKLTGDQVKSMSKSTFLNLDSTRLATYLQAQNFEKVYTVDSIKSLIKSNTVQVIDIYNYTHDANRLLFDTPVIGAELYYSADQGKSWKKTHEGYLDGLYHSYGYYFGLVEVAHEKPETVIIGGVPILKSLDGGKTFENINQENVHVDHHALWINPDNTQHIINGNDGGINISYDGGVTYIPCNSPAVGQFYTINVDYAKNYNVFGGTQDNGVWRGPNNYKYNRSWQITGNYPYDRIMGGDGMQIQIDRRNTNIIYTGYQFGNYFKINFANKSSQYITPKHKLGQSPYRWNWQTPILLSKYNQDILYMGANKLLRSMNAGKSFEEISPDLTKGGKKGDVAFGTLTSISESPFKYGIIYTGSDDGNLHRTEDNGHTWKAIDNGLPKNLWVSRVVASKHNAEHVYAALNGYRNDDFTPYLYHSTNKGDSWRAIGQNLPLEPINVIIEDSKFPHILFVGTDNGLYVSYDSGKTFEILGQLPRVAVHDLVIQTEANELIVGTHGRSLYKIDLAILHQYAKQPTKALIASKKVYRRYNSYWGAKNTLDGTFNEAKKSIWIFSTTPAKNVSYSIKDSEGTIIQQGTKPMERGYNSIDIPLHIELDQYKTVEPAENGKRYLPKGAYTVEFKTTKAKTEVELHIK